MTGIDPVLRALAHPVRLRMMTLMWPGPMSAAELARELDISHALASQHLRRLDAAGLVELAEQRTRRGGRERRYRAVHGAPLSEQREGAEMLAGTLAHTLRERAAQRAPEGEGVTTDAELWVDPGVWEDVRRRLADLAMELHDAARPPRTPHTSRVGLTVMAFPMRQEEAPAGEEGTG
ncbi:ArsR/SmtB family transcription factor [Streptomyces marispadix]|uniref:Winged helix-turn-helix domain-containing protein n=1 Tax=Streptomyces marispadix TaxID=2922868 RepID=A0ABS9T5D3_9ACTN|nr:winged helix-turn-helix domain-containing protein [Streptomyces marispadix]MCH6163754.1 winged helix-turn-helix domain-containing protein [Streptomyces marispadix]